MGYENIWPGYWRQLSLYSYLLSKNLRSYDRSVVLNYLAYFAFIEEDYESAMHYYDAILNEPDVTLPIRLSSLETLIRSSSFCTP